MISTDSVFAPVRGRFSCAFGFALVAGLFASLGAPRATAQSVPPATTARNAASGETIELTPFVIREDQDTGYVATSSLAGSRLNTSLRDTAASLSVLTKEFMDDI